MHRTVSRRALRAIAVVVAAAIPLLMPQAAQAATSAGSYPMQGYGPARNALSISETTINSSNVGTLAQHFSKPAGHGLATAPTVGDGLAYVGYGSTSRHPYVLSAYRLVSGATVWKLPALSSSSAVFLQPVLSGSVLYLAEDVHVLAVDAATGHVRWTSAAFSTAAQGLNVVGTVIYTVISGNLTALSTVDGSVLWSVPTDNSYSLVTYWQNQLFIFDHDTVTGNDEVHAFRASDGGSLWDVPLVGLAPRNGAVAVAGGGVYVVTDQATSLLRTSDGGVVWQRPVGSFVNLALAYGSVYVIGSKGHVTALSQADGHTVWQSAAATYSNDFSDPIVANGVLFAANAPVNTNPDVLAALDANTGAALWTSSVVGSIVVDFSVTGGKVIAVAGDTTALLFEFTLSGR